MQGLQTLDAGLFRFLHDFFRHPALDAVMRALSDSPLFLPVALLLGIGLAFRGGVRGRVFLVLLVLALLVNDGLLSNTLKELVARPRPWVVEPGIELLSPSGSAAYRSLPSSHASNWAALTLVAFAFYRRSLWFTVPLALAVSFSRIYNGAHYPGDVLVGWFLGAGAGAFTLVMAQWLWTRGVARLFPLWQARLPSLVPPLVAPPNALGNAGQEGAALREQQWLQLGYLLIGGLLVFRLWYISSGIINLTGDEAYQWMWSKHLALSYYSKPPLIALTQWTGTHLWGDRDLGVRFFSPVLAAAMGVLLLRWMSREVSPRAAVALVVCAATTPLLIVGATLMTVDPLNVFFWLAAMVTGWRAVGERGTTADWLWTGLWMGVSFLSKYTALLEPAAFALFFVLWRPARRHLRRPGPWLALGVLALATLPVLIWNAQHGWATVQHVSDDGKFGGKITFTLKYFWEFFGAELALLNPVYFLGMLAAVVGMWRGPRREGFQVYLFCMGATTAGLYLLQSLHARVLPNWIAPAIVPWLALMVVWWRNHWDRRWVRRTWLGGVALGAVALVIMADTNLIAKVIGRPLPPKMDPLNRARGWPAVSAAVRGAYEQLSAEGKPTFVIASDYGLTGLTTFYWPEARSLVNSPDPRVVCELTPNMKNQFLFWPHYDYRKRTGANAIFACMRRHEASDTAARIPTPEAAPEDITARFESVTPLPPVVILHKGRFVRWLQLYECRGLR